jgi:hypothetical protein
VEEHVGEALSGKNDGGFAGRQARRNRRPSSPWGTRSLRTALKGGVKHLPQQGRLVQASKFASSRLLEVFYGPSTIRTYGTADPSIPETLSQIQMI